MQDNFLHALAWLTLHIHQVWNFKVDECGGKMFVSHAFYIVKSQLFILKPHLPLEANLEEF
jgi:hypothetical protein